jgi:hypothetical protein
MFNATFNNISVGANGVEYSVSLDGLLGLSIRASGTFTWT